MRKILLISVFCFTISILNCAENGITKVLDVVSMKINYKNNAFDQVIIKAGNRFMVRIDYKLFLNDKVILYSIYLKPINEKTILDEINRKYSELHIVSGYAGFGTEDEIDELNKFGTKYKSSNRVEIKKCAFATGGIASDELLYYLKINKSKYFKECLIVFYDVWDRKKFDGRPNSLSNKLIDELKKNKDPKADNYIMIDKIIDSIQFIGDKSSDVKKK
jgi:hypothetical protein